MGALDALINLAVDQNRRGNLSDIMDGLNDGSIPQNQALIKMAQATGDPNDMMNAVKQQTINAAQGLNPDGTPKVAQGANMDGSAGYSAPATQQTIPAFEQSLGQNTGSPDVYLQGRTRQIASNALANLPAGASPIDAVRGVGTQVAQQTGDVTGLQTLTTFLQNYAKTQSEINKNNAETGKAASETFTNPATGAAMTPGQKDVDSEFAKTYTNFANSGGSKNIDVANGIINQTIQGLTNGQIQTGRLTDRMSTDTEGHPTYMGKAIDPQVLIAKNRIDSTVAPLLKPLFGARVTNFDASSMMNSMGLNPMAKPEENIAQLQDLQKRLQGGQNDLQASGQYFQQHGTLAGYTGNQGQGAGAQTTTTPSVAPPQMTPYQQQLMQEFQSRKAKAGAQ